MTGRSAQTARDWVEAARGRCDLQALEDLWAAVPEAMRLSRFAESTVAPQYAGAFCHDGTWRAGVDLSQLPDPMRREVAWCVFRIIELGGKISTPALSMLVRRLGEVIADRGGRRFPCSDCRCRSGANSSSVRCIAAAGGCRRLPR